MGDGAGINAWRDVWSPLDLPLNRYVDRNVTDIDMNAKLSSFVTSSGSWDVEKW